MGPKNVLVLKSASAIKIFKIFVNEFLCMSMKAEVGFNGIFMECQTKDLGSIPL